MARIAMVDALRGYALLGLFLVHMSEYFELYWLNSRPSVTHDIIFALFAGKAYAILALCFGFSFYIQGARAHDRGDAFAGRFAWRLLLLFAIGSLHGLIYRGDIIVTLAALGFLLIPLFYVRSRALIAGIALFCFAQPLLLAKLAAALAGQRWGFSPPGFFDDPSMKLYATGNFADLIAANLGPAQANKWSFYVETGRVFQIFGLFAVGLALGRSGWFARGDGRRSAWAHAGLAAIVWAALYGIRSIVLARVGQEPGAPMAITFILNQYFELAATILSVLLFVAAYGSILRAPLKWLVPAGRMTLTLYIGQSLVFVPVFYNFGLGQFRVWSQETAIAVGIAAFVAQLLFARWYFTHFAYGPLEWLWRAATRLTTDIPFRKAPSR